MHVWAQEMIKTMSENEFSVGNIPDKGNIIMNLCINKFYQLVKV